MHLLTVAKTLVAPPCVRHFNICLYAHVSTTYSSIASALVCCVGETLVPHTSFFISVTSVTVSLDSEQSRIKSKNRGTLLENSGVGHSC
jgi:hypothetical protein